MNRKKLIRRTALHAKIVKKWMVYRWCWSAYRECLREIYLERQTYVFLGVDGIHESTYDYPGRKLISENLVVESSDEPTG